MSLDPTKSYTLEEITAAGEPEFFNADPLFWKALLVAEFERITKRPLYESQVEMYIIEVMSYALAIRASELQYAVVQRLLAFAFDRFLDLLASRVRIYRLKASHAGTTIRFTLSAPRPSTIAIPKDTRVRSQAGDHLFLTDADLLIQPGTTFGDVHVTAAEGGMAANDIDVGGAYNILDPVAGVSTAVSTIASSGGADEEGDNSLRLRASEAWELISRGGPRAGYEQLARGAHPDIIDVAVIRPQPCEIIIYPLTATLPPSPEVIAAIHAACDPIHTRPEGDEFFVEPPVAVTAAPIVHIWVESQPDTLQAQADATVRGIFAAWRDKLGIKIATGTIVKTLMAIKGIDEATIEGLTYRDLADNEYVILIDLTIIVHEAS